MSATNELRRRLSAAQSLPRPACRDRPPSHRRGPAEIKHDGVRILTHRRGRSVRLYSRNGHNFADRFPLSAAAIEALAVRSCVIDGEATVCDDNVWRCSISRHTNARATYAHSTCSKVNGEDISSRALLPDERGPPLLAVRT